MRESTDPDEFADWLLNQRAVQTVQMLGEYLSVEIHRGVEKRFNEGGTARTHGWAIVSVNFEHDILIMAPIDRLAELSPVAEVDDA